MLEWCPPTLTAKALVPVVQKQTPPESWRHIIQAGELQDWGWETSPNKSRSTPYDAEMIPTPQMGDG